ncbi:MAG: exported protein of unknown function [Promethearchaeota archaeon]|nr:MAG: exported protein of unknown function [Candidatus Lokiarchaeota archaeon]
MNNRYIRVIFLVLLAVLSVSILFSESNMPTKNTELKNQGIKNFSSTLYEASGEWSNQQVIEIGGCPSEVIIEDVNNDDIDDIFVISSLSFPFTLVTWNDSIQDWNPLLYGVGGLFPCCGAVGDVNNDNYNDIVVGNFLSDLNIFCWNETSSEWNPALTHEGVVADTIVIGDANNDGYNDIVTINFMLHSLTVSVWNEVAQGWNPAIDLPVGSGPLDVKVGDVNNDGLNEIVVVNSLFSTISIFTWNDLTQEWNLPIDKATGNGPESICIGDANNDEYNDIIIAIEDQVSIMTWNTILDDWNPCCFREVGNDPKSVALDDVNDDGLNDIVTPNNMDDTISILLWNDTIQDWNPQIIRSVGESPEDIGVGDINNDGYNDIVTANYDDETLSVYFGEDSAPPTWVQMPRDQFIKFGYSFMYDVNAFDPSGIDQYWLTGTSCFTINNEGIITNTSVLLVGDYWFTIHVNDTLGYERSCVIKISVQDIGTQTSDIIDELFAYYLDEYATYGYFPSYYESSLQGVYYVLSILNVTEQLTLINPEEMADIIMSYFDDTMGLFIDTYAERYLDTDFELDFSILNSLLEVNCYAILSLELIGKLDLIEPQIQDFIDFIWDCFDTTEGGFIGQQYNESLHQYFNVATLDNTYFAVKTLNLLMDSWMSYSIQKTQIISFIESLQNLDPILDFYGSFENDQDPDYHSLRIFGPNMISSYYALNTLDIFDMWEVINVDAFHSFLDNAYHDTEGYFECVELAPYNNYSLYSATAIGLELSILTEFSGINEATVLEFLLSNRNSLGIWDSSPTFGFYELIDTFQIIRSLLSCSRLNDLGAEDTQDIANAMDLFKSGNGYSIISREYTKLEQIYAIVESFWRYERISDLQLNELYESISEAYYDLQGNEYKGFYGYIDDSHSCELFRVPPVEFFNIGMHDYIEQIDYMVNHKFTYEALLSLEKLFKLDDFAFSNNLTKLLESIEHCQILDPQSNYFGAFLPFEYWTERPIDDQEKMVFFEQTYFAVKTIDFLMDYLGLGELSDANIDLNAINVYIFRNILEYVDLQYYEPEYSEISEIVLKNTYYAIKTSKILEEYNLNDQKIENFVIQTMDYINIENIYYCYKIDQLLNLKIQFDTDKTHTLIHNIYSEMENKLYLTPNHISMSFEVLRWLTEMATEDEYRYEIDMSPEILLEGENQISVSICNIVLEELGSYATVKIESEQLGIHTFERLFNGSYEYNAHVPLESNNFPMIYANICVYENLDKVAEYPISFSTSYELNTDFSISGTSSNREIEISASITSALGDRPLYDGTVYANIYHNGEFLETILMQKQEFSDYTKFKGNFELRISGNYRVEVYVNDGINLTDCSIGISQFMYNIPLLSPFSPFFVPSKNPSNSGENLGFSSKNSSLFILLITLIALPLGVIGYTTLLKKKHKYN